MVVVVMAVVVVLEIVVVVLEVVVIVVVAPIVSRESVDISQQDLKTVCEGRSEKQ